MADPTPPAPATSARAPSSRHPLCGTLARSLRHRTDRPAGGRRGDAARVARAGEPHSWRRLVEQRHCGHFVRHRDERAADVGQPEHGGEARRKCRGGIPSVPPPHRCRPARSRVVDQRRHERCVGKPMWATSAVVPRIVTPRPPGAQALVFLPVDRHRRRRAEIGETNPIRLARAPCRGRGDRGHRQCDGADDRRDVVEPGGATAAKTAGSSAVIIVPGSGQLPSPSRGCAPETVPVEAGRPRCSPGRRRPTSPWTSQSPAARCGR